MKDQAIDILIVEDNLAHLQLTEYILRRNNFPGTIHVVRDGQEALDYLFRKLPFSDVAKFPIPDLILLDLNLPKRDGREVLKILKDDASLKDIPVVIVSTSDREEDVAFALQHGAAAYISKSSGFEILREKLATVTQYARRP
ncbi:MAG: response regulator [Bacteroidota bacterium]